MKLLLLLGLAMLALLTMKTDLTYAVPIEGACKADFVGNDGYGIGRVNLGDISALGGPSYNKSEGQAGYHPRFDMNGSNSVNLSDVSYISTQGWYNQDCTGGRYVEAWHQQLYTPSNPDFIFTGANRYNLLTIDPPSAPYRGCGSAWTEAQIDTWLEELESQGTEVIRMWLFQNFTDSGTDFDRFDYVLEAAWEHKMRVMPVLENQWDDCTEGGDKHEEWYEDGYLSPYGNYSESLKDYTDIVVNRYKNDERIAMWQIMNEAGISLSGGGCGDPAIFRAMADDIATDIQAIDSNHLVSFGTMGGGQCGAQGEDYETLHDLDSIDICEYHDYNDIAEPIPGDQWNGMQVRLDQCENIDKPIFVGEAGMDLIEESITEQERADYFDAKIDAFFGEGGTGYLIWSYRDVDGADSLEYDADDPLADVIGGY